MKRALVLGMAWFAVAAGTAAAQAAPEVIGVFPVKATNLTEGEAAAIGTLIAVSYSAQTNAHVLDPSETGPVLAQQVSPRDAARQLGLTQYVEVKAVRLAQRITVQATLYNVHGSPLFEVNTTATSLDDMEPVAERVAASLHRRTPLEETRTMDNITGKEAGPTNRMFAEKVFGVRTGVAVPFGKDVNADAALFAEFDGRLEGESYFLEFGAGLMLPSSFDSSGDEGIGGLIGLIGGSYYLTHTNVAPYIGAGFSPRIMFGAYSGAALTVNGKIGLMFMRMSSSRIYVEIGIDQHLLPLSPDYYDERYDPNTGRYVSIGGDQVWPTEPSIAIGIGW